MKEIKIEVKGIEMGFTKYVDYYEVYYKPTPEHEYETWVRFLDEEKAKKECEILSEQGLLNYVCKHSIFV